MIKIPPCEKCSLYNYRKNMVVGRGSVPADILFMGEAPGKSEDLLGEAFIGPSGKLLDKIIYDAGGESISYYICNTVLCRPTDMLRGPNREPLPSEVLACTENIMKIVDAVNPKQIVFIGRVSESYYKSEFPEGTFMYHPAFLLRHGGPSSHHYPTVVQTLKEVINKL